jgi:hypothetical protein
MSVRNPRAGGLDGLDASPFEAKALDEVLAEVDAEGWAEDADH